MSDKIQKYILACLLFVTQTMVCQVSDFPEKPNPPHLVTDFTMSLNQEETNALEQKLKSYNDSTSSQIAIVVVKNIGDYEINQYATELAIKWGIGQKGKNNGLLILWATENRKVYIATGYGFEEKVPDAIAKRIVNQLIIPNFKLGQYYQGLNLATDEIMARMSGQFEADASDGGGEFPIFFFILIIFLIILFIMFMIRKNGGKGNKFNDRNRGDGFGGGLGGGLPWIISSGGGSSWGGGGNDWGGGDSGGGFGGFGGGDFGGGGAGGDY